MTWGPPMTNLPDDWMWKTVCESTYCRGMTTETTLSISCFRSSDVEISSECWTDTTTVWTRTGIQAPFSMRYSHVTFTHIYKVAYILRNVASVYTAHNHHSSWLYLITNEFKAALYVFNTKDIFVSRICSGWTSTIKRNLASPWLVSCHVCQMLLYKSMCCGFLFKCCIILLVWDK